MNHNRIPDNDELARRIATAFDALPGPDEERLEAVRARLETQLKRPSSRSHGKRWIWLLLLAGGAATAAWWGGNLLTSDSKAEQLIKESVTKPKKSYSDNVLDNNKNRTSSSDTDVNNARNQETPVIYKRESY